MTTNHDLRAYRQMMVARNPNATDAQIDAAVIEYDRHLDECVQHEKTNRRVRRSEAARMKRARAQRIAQEDGMALVAVKWVS